MITVSEETTIDFDVTARSATEAFASKDIVFSAERIKWLYERGFSQGTIVVAAYDGATKVGQIALVCQAISSNGVPGVAGQLVDLWVLKAYRSPSLIRRIYSEIERLCLSRNIRFIVALPNENSQLLNERFLKLKPLMWLHPRAGIGLWRPPTSRLKYSGYLKSLTRQAAVDLLSGFTTEAAETGSSWNGETLFERTSDPTCDYAAHATSDLLLISSARKTRGIPYTLLCGFLIRPRATVTPACVRELVGAACRFRKRPLFVYAGVNNHLPALPGTALSPRLRKPMLVQLRRLTADGPDLRFDRFQLIDTDFA